ncbi:hypothetical protein AB833_16600 [Chromatiales bacterium (ex Bugula neritina AB1)]|nr:hypothetical protein AB833_16600 [Chromatiales bacterium (ex Bugula neritina AB1)]
MQLYFSLLTIVMLAFCITFGLSIRSLLAEKSLRRYWTVCVAAAGAVALAIFSGVFVGGNSLVASASMLLMFAVSVLLLGQLWVVKRSLIYMKNIHSINGVSIIDPLTGVYNRFYLEQRLTTEIARSHRYNTPLALIAVEIDEFKLFVDEFGHQLGEMAVQKLSDKFVSMLRETDVVVRYADGQFILMLPDTPEGNTQGLLDRIETAVCGMVVVTGAGVESSIKINSNFGLSHCVIGTQNAAELIDAAFRSMYTNNRFSCESDIVESIGVVG